MPPAIVRGPLSPRNYGVQTKVRDTEQPSATIQHLQSFKFNSKDYIDTLLSWLPYFLSRSRDRVASTMLLALEVAVGLIAIYKVNTNTEYKQTVTSSLVTLANLEIMCMSSS